MPSFQLSASIRETLLICRVAPWAGRRSKVTTYRSGLLGAAGMATPRCPNR